MSHFVKAKSQITDKELVIKALNRLGWEHEVGNFSITQYGQTSKAEIKFSNAIGLTQEADGTWALVGDPYHHRDSGGGNYGRNNLGKYYGKQDQFMKDLSTAYLVEEATQKLENLQFRLEDNAEAKVGEDGLIHITYQSDVW